MRFRTINLIAACGCLICCTAHTLSHGPLVTIVGFVVVGLANLAFVLAK
jgi:hypothetical protein